MLSGDVYKNLKQDIIASTFKPGQKLKLSELKMRYNTGTSPVREALFQLTHSGFVTAEVQKGFRVAPMSAGDGTDLCLCLSDVAIPMLKQTIERGREAWEAGVIAKSYLLKKLLSHKKLDVWKCLTSLHQFYLWLWSPVTSLYRKEQFRVWFELLSRYVFLGAFKAGFIKQLLQRHCDLAELVCTRQFQKSRAVMMDILNCCAQQIVVMSP